MAEWAAISPKFRAVSNDLQAADAASLLLLFKNESISFDFAREDNESTGPSEGKRNETKENFVIENCVSRSL